MNSVSIGQLNKNMIYRAIKSISYNILNAIIYYTRLIRLVNLFANHFRPNIDKKNGGTFPYIEKRRSRNVQILMYHKINDDHEHFFPGMPVDQFGRQMRYLSSKYSVLPLVEAVDRLKRNDVPENAVVVTFDDGYKDNHVHAYPILTGLSIPATIFLATDAIGSGETLWHDNVFIAFRETRVTRLEHFGDSPGVYPLGNIEEKSDALRVVMKYLRTQDDVGRRFWIGRLIEVLQVDVKTKAAGLMMTWADVQEMHGNGISFGSHTATHAILSRLSPEKARSEIHDSRITMEKILGTPVTTFAYPNGQPEDFNKSIKEFIRDDGYVCALTTLFGANEVGEDLYEMKRGNPWEDNIPSFAVKMNWYKYRSWV